MKPKIMCIGMCGIDVLIKGADLKTPFIKEGKPVESVDFSVGGDAANEAVTLSSLGSDTMLVSGIGRDDTGKLIKTILESANVRTNRLVYDEKNKSSINVVVIGEDGQRNFLSPPDTEAWKFEMPLEDLKDVSIISLGSLMIPPFDECENICRIVKAAKNNGACVCADVIAGEHRKSLDEIKEALFYIDYFFPNDYEAELLTGKKDVEEMADEFLKYGIKNVIIKIGKNGCFVKNKERAFRMSAYSVDAVDTTGAGDNFAAGFIHALSEGKSLEECCKFAAAVAAIAVQKVGANGAVKSKEQVLSFMESHKLRGECE
nr:carbohydrate kinase family protein [uncultured Mediterraneibacter sp.]